MWGCVPVPCLVSLLLLSWPLIAAGLYFPDVNPAATWQTPFLQPWDPVRASNTSITVHWTPAWNPWSEIERYELEARRPAGGPTSLANLERLQFGELQTGDPEGPGDEAWQPWKVVYAGLGRGYTLGVPAGTGHAAQFRVRACGPILKFHNCSNWSPTQTAHTVLGGAVDKVNIFIRGSGKNAPNYTIIEVNQKIVYKRRDETGLVLAVFSRLDFSLRWLQTYDTHRFRNASIEMSHAIRQFNQSFFVMVVSSIAWEWHASRTLGRTMEFCGAYHFGQWSNTFAEQGHYESPISDIQQAASQEEFGHPYAFIGIPGVGTGMGWESLMYNTGHYLAGATIRVPQAIIRAVAYYDYVSRQYRLQDVVATKAPFYLQGSAPAAETLHNPTPSAKNVNEYARIPNMKSFRPYVGTLSTHISKLLEANASVPPYNYAFVIQTVAGVRKIDPRPHSWWITELERIWSGPSNRFWPEDGELIAKGIELADRNCSYFVYHGYLDASPEKCGENGVLCCPQIDTPNFVAATCGVGVAPTICTNSTRISTGIENFTVLGPPYVPKWNATNESMIQYGE